MTDVDTEDDETYSAVRTLLGSTNRDARWHLTDEVDVLTALGRARFDLRQVETTGRPVTEISVTCVLGSVYFVVPPGTLVVLDGTSFLARAGCEVAPGAESELPRIEITANTYLGRVRVVSAEPEAAPVEAIEVASEVVAAAPAALAEAEQPAGLPSAQPEGSDEAATDVVEPSADAASLAS